MPLGPRPRSGGFALKNLIQERSAQLRERRANGPDFSDEEARRLSAFLSSEKSLCGICGKDVVHFIEDDSGQKVHEWCFWGEDGPLVFGPVDPKRTRRA